ncbi:PD-(D/E)XK nuclease family protein [Natrarchaeobaculum aegyptiacum]|uniref:Uncharacterized protein n=1 Tax=Natrarchaeobaculum aegyptiacum TaxID=745377 RepID=A0A2Z2HW21_9EURY|nr:PD-(D/E)XK nuclease family protein [Natrarchaeobaculum aegyptiacum]ARS91422.1 hypothetical protein B1756_17980 [Natrarchaeobaculum aegyptiacum]
MTDPVARVTVAELETALHCPRRYAFAYVDDLEASDDHAGENGGPTARADLLARAITTALRSGEPEAEELLAVASDRLESLWSGHEGSYHSSAQRRHVRAVLESTLEAYVDQFGVDHARGCRRLLETIERPDDDREHELATELIGPDRPLAASVQESSAVPETERTRTADGGDGESAREQSARIRIDATVDYVTTDGTDLVGVRFVPSASPLGPLRYRSSWDDELLQLVDDHLEKDNEAFDPGPVAALFETSVVLEGLRGLRDRLGLPDRPCRYVQLPVADRWNSSTDWISGSVETTLEAVDLTDVYVDERDYAMDHVHRNRAVDDRLTEFAAGVCSGDHDPTDRWRSIEPNACPECAYAVCCPEYVASEVRFDG